MYIFFGIMLSNRKKQGKIKAVRKGLPEKSFKERQFKTMKNSKTKRKRGKK